MKRTAYNFFIRGAGSVIDLLPSGGRSTVGEGINLGRSDAQALQRDWRRVARDFRTAFEQTTGERREYVHPEQGE